MDNEIYPRNKFKKFHTGRYNAKDTGVNALKQRDSAASFLPLELTLKLLKQIKNSEGIVKYAVKADFARKH
jgi:hypothetical protein